MTGPLQRRTLPGVLRTGRIDLSEAPFTALFAVVLLLVGVPLVTSAISSLRPGSSFPFEAGDWTLANYSEVFGSQLTFQLIRNTIIYAVSTLALAIPIAFLLAWLVERTDMPFGDLLYTVILFPMAIPPLLQVIGWALVLTPLNGVINVWLRALLRTGQAAGPLDLYTLPGFVFVTVLAVVPGTFIMLAGMLRNLDPQLEEAATTSGANLGHTLRRITLPLVAPGLLATFVYYSIVLIALFEIPLAIGQSAQFPVLSIQIYAYTRPPTGELPRYGLAAAYGLFGLALGLALLWLYRRATAASQRYAVVGGKGFGRQRAKLGRLKYVALAFVGAYILLAAVLPLAMLVWTSFLPFYEPPSLATLAKVTWRNYAAIADDPRLVTATLNTVMVLVASATTTVVFAALLAWTTQRKTSRAGSLMDFLVFLTAAVPGIVLALAVLLFYIRTPMWGTIWILAVAQLIHSLPFTTRVMSAALVQIHTELEEVAWTSGASKLETFRRVLLPLLAPALANGWIWVAVHSMRDFTFPIMLGTLGNLVIPSLIWSLWRNGDHSRVGAMATLLVLTSILFTFAARRFIARATV